MSERHRPWGTLLLKTLKVLKSTENKSLRERKRAERDMRATRKKKRERKKSLSVVNFPLGTDRISLESKKDDSEKAIQESLSKVLSWCRHERAFLIFQLGDSSESRKFIKNWIWYLQNVKKRARLMNLAFTICYSGAYMMVMIEFIVNGFTNSFWQSTTLWPWKWAHTPVVYYLILLLQILTNAVNAVVAAMTDTFLPILSIILGGHLSVLGVELQHLRPNENGSSPLEDVNKLIKCIKYHDLCVRYASSC